MQFYRLRKDVVVAPDAIASIAVNDIASMEEVVICLKDDSVYRIEKRRYAEQYRSLKAYVESVPTLASELDPEEVRRREVEEAESDLFLGRSDLP